MEMAKPLSPQYGNAKPSISEECNKEMNLSESDSSDESDSSNPDSFDVNYDNHQHHPDDDDDDNGSIISPGSESDWSAEGGDDDDGAFNFEGEGNEIKPPENSTSRKIYNRVNTLSLVWCTEYSQDIIKTLMETENHRKRILFRSRQIENRPDLINLIRNAAEEFSLCRTTVHLAVYMLDVFMDNFKILDTKLKLVALVCLFLASKIEECDYNIPKMCRLISKFGQQYTKNEFKCLEIRVLMLFEWSLLQPNVATFVQGLTNHLIAPEDFGISTTLSNSITSNESSSCCSNSSSNINKNSYSVKTYQFMKNCTSSIDSMDCIRRIHSAKDLLFEFLDITLQDQRFVNIKPSLVAAACVAGVRKIEGFHPIWPGRLKELTSYDSFAIKEYTRTLISFRGTILKRKLEKCSPDSAFRSSSNTESSDTDGDDEDNVDGDDKDKKGYKNTYGRRLYDPPPKKKLKL